MVESKIETKPNPTGDEGQPPELDDSLGPSVSRPTPGSALGGAETKAKPCKMDKAYTRIGPRGRKNQGKAMQSGYHLEMRSSGFLIQTPRGFHPGSSSPS